MDADYHRYYRTLQRRRRRDTDPYRQYRVSAGVPLESVDLPVAWPGHYPLIGVSDYRLADTARANSYTAEVSEWILHLCLLHCLQENKIL